MLGSLFSYCVLRIRYEIRNTQYASFRRFRLRHRLRGRGCRGRRGCRAGRRRDDLRRDCLGNRLQIQSQTRSHLGRCRCPAACRINRCGLPLCRNDSRGGRRRQGNGYIDDNRFGRYGRCLILLRRILRGQKLCAQKGCCQTTRRYGCFQNAHLLSGA